MHQPLTNILVKIFARGFYKVNSGLLIFLFVVFVSYCFFVNTLGDVTLLPPGKELYYHFMILVTFVSSPAMMLLFFTAWLFYTLKSWQYVSAQLRVVHHEFLYYSLLSAPKGRQFKGWFITQFVISLPFLIYAILAAVVGIVLSHYIIAAVILAFTLALIAAAAFVYMQQLNQLVYEKPAGRMLTLGRNWKKPFFSLFLYYMADSLKLAFVLTKVLSFVAIIAVTASFGEAGADSRIAAFAILCVALAHAILIYQQHHFTLVWLDLLRNLPRSLGWLFLQQSLTYLLILLPEAVWLFSDYSTVRAAGMLLLLLSFMLLFHCMLYRIGLAMNKYLPWLLGIFFTIWLLILFSFIWLLAPACLVISFLIFYTNYYKQELLEA